MQLEHLMRNLSDLEVAKIRGMEFATGFVNCNVS